MGKALLSVPVVILFLLCLYSCQPDDPGSFLDDATDPEQSQEDDEGPVNEKADTSETVMDYDGNSYTVIQIGDQAWMGENLRATHYADGTPIPFVGDGRGWTAVNYPQKAYCWYDDNPLMAESFGALYNYAAAMNSADSSSASPSGVQGVCPDGWHLPSDAEWKQLEMYLGMDRPEADARGWRGTDQGGSLKEAGTAHWTSPNSGATNASGFNALPGGERSYDGIFYNGGLYSRMWSSSMQTYYICYRSLSYDGSQVGRHYYCRKNIGYSVRCVRD